MKKICISLVLLGFAIGGALFAFQAANSTTITLDGSMFATTVTQARSNVVNNYLLRATNFPISAVLRSFSTLPMLATGNDIDQITLKELLRRKAIYLSSWDATNGNGVISSPAPNAADLTAYFETLIDNQIVPLSVVIPANFGGTVHGDANSLVVNLNSEVNITFQKPVDGHTLPSLNLFNISVTSSNLVYRAHEAGSPATEWAIVINLNPQLNK